ncbi:hypothetical protein BT96DRAFT_943369 [Gymnopus androsaceus JB14]|uniref:Uncharacterized protein n=1 Tax=Gymnopus androsaceus JB14 TaxID=1447944 RepID=A0A6A4H8R3_9AGAR|nr:hypothetical protein BT96DRAFT_943369 [Gymnopus androsaceus JB14]
MYNCHLLLEMATRTRARTSAQTRAQTEESTPAAFSVLAPHSRHLVQTTTPASVPSVFSGTATEPASPSLLPRQLQRQPRHAVVPIGGQQLGAMPDPRPFETPSRSRPKHLNGLLNLKEDKGRGIKSHIWLLDHGGVMNCKTLSLVSVEALLIWEQQLLNNLWLNLWKMHKYQIHKLRNSEEQQGIPIVEMTEFSRLQTPVAQNASTPMHLEPWVGYHEQYREIMVVKYTIICGNGELEETPIEPLQDGSEYYYN